MTAARYCPQQNPPTCYTGVHGALCFEYKARPQVEPKRRVLQQVPREKGHSLPDGREHQSSDLTVDVYHFFPGHLDPSGKRLSPGCPPPSATSSPTRASTLPPPLVITTSPSTVLTLKPGGHTGTNPLGSGGVTTRRQLPRNTNLPVESQEVV